MKYIKILQYKMLNAECLLRHLYYIKIIMRGDFFMMKLLARMAEKYAKATNTSCVVWWALHQPKMPASLIKKD